MEKDRRINKERKRIYDLLGHKPSEEWINKTPLEIISASPKAGYYIRHGNKGIIFWGIDGNTILEYLHYNYVSEGFQTIICCDFITSYGRAQGSAEHPITLNWKQETL